MPLGDKLRSARLEKKLTIAQVAAATQIKPHVIEEIERDDFTKITAPIYGKGFVKLYAQCVGLDPIPLVNEYVRYYAKYTRPSLQTDGVRAENRGIPNLDKMKVLQDYPDDRVGTDLSGPTIEHPVEEKAAPVAPAARQESRQIPAPAVEARPLQPAIPEADSSHEHTSWRKRTGEDSSRNVMSLVFQYGPIVLGIIVLIIVVASVMTRCVRRSAPTPAVTSHAPAVKPPPDKIKVAVEPPDPYFKK